MKDNQSTTHIFIIEDDEIMFHGLELLLSGQGYRVSGAHSGETAISAINTLQTSTTPIDLLICDWRLPDMTGPDIVRRLRLQHNFGIIMFTEMNEDADKVTGFHAGIDDYVVKGTSPQELLLRIKALLRRTPGQQDTVSPVLRFSDFRFDPDKREVRLPTHRKITLTEGESSVLHTLCLAKGEIMDRQTLASRCGLSSPQSQSRTIDVLISRLRRKLHHSDENPVILSFRSKGYLLIH